MSECPCGYDAFYTKTPWATYFLALFSRDELVTCADCDHAVENGGKCIEGDAEWVYAVDHARNEYELDGLAQRLAFRLEHPEMVPE